MGIQKRNKEIGEINKKLKVEEEVQRKRIKEDFERAVTELKKKVAEEYDEVELTRKNAELKSEMQNIMDGNKKHTQELELRSSCKHCINHFFS